jgi:dihydrofolate synthase/folylpolyglutamate synthase
MLHAMLSQAGYKTGLYTSPHLVSFCERFQVNGKPIAEPDVVRLVEEIKPFLEKVAANPEFHAPTFFEAITAIALRYFREQNVDVVVWETGLGGRLGGPGEGHPGRHTPVVVWGGAFRIATIALALQGDVIP